MSCQAADYRLHTLQGHQVLQVRRDSRECGVNQGSLDLQDSQDHQAPGAYQVCLEKMWVLLFSLIPETLFNAFHEHKLYCMSQKSNQSFVSLYHFYCLSMTCMSGAKQRRLRKQVRLCKLWPILGNWHNRETVFFAWSEWNNNEEGCFLCGLFWEVISGKCYCAK
jgi:hypothetical protein